jgi:hypothetical protein
MRNYFTLIGVAILACGLGPLLCAQADETISTIDFDSLANRKLTDNLGSGADDNSLSEMPMGEQVLEGVKFKIGPGLIQLGSKLMDSFPEKVEGIKINHKFSKLHLLHATCFGGGPNQEGDPGHVKDGTLIGQYLVHFEDGSSEGIPIIYGEDVRDWWFVGGEPGPSRGKVVWTGDNGYATEIGAHLRLYASSWTNPKPDKKVVRIDYVSRKSETPAAPFCISMSVEGK